MGWINGKSGFDPWHGQEIFLFFTASRPVLRPRVKVDGA
jgi:hypothetical protein